MEMKLVSIDPDDAISDYPWAATGAIGDWRHVALGETQDKAAHNCLDWLLSKRSQLMREVGSK